MIDTSRTEFRDGYKGMRMKFRNLMIAFVLLLLLEACATIPCDALIEQDVFTKMGCLGEYRTRDEELLAEKEKVLEKKAELLNFYSEVLETQEKYRTGITVTTADKVKLNSELNRLRSQVATELEPDSKYACLQQHYDILTKDSISQSDLAELERLSYCLDQVVMS